MIAQDIHLSDAELWEQFKEYYQQGEYGAAIALLNNSQLAKKGLTATVLNSVNDLVVQIQNTSDPSFKADKIPCQTNQPTQTAGEVWFKITG